MKSVKTTKIINAFLEYNVPAEWFLMATNQDNEIRTHSTHFIKSNNLDYFHLRFFQHVKTYLGIDALKMPISDLISTLKYVKALEIEREEMSNLQ